MEISTIADLRIIGRAVREGWGVTPEMKADALAEIHSLIKTSEKPALKIKAIAVLKDIDALNVKVEQLQVREQKAHEDRRLQLLEFAKRIPIGELTKLTSGDIQASSAASRME